MTKQQLRDRCLRVTLPLTNDRSEAMKAGDALADLFDELAGERVEPAPSAQSTAGTLTCCFIGAAGPCGRLAEYQILERGTTRRAGVDDDSYACAAHVGDMLGHAGEPTTNWEPNYVVTPLDSEAAKRGECRWAKVPPPAPPKTRGQAVAADMVKVGAITSDSPYLSIGGQPGAHFRLAGASGWLNAAKALQETVAAVVDRERAAAAKEEREGCWRAAYTHLDCGNEGGDFRRGVWSCRDVVSATIRARGDAE